ncbi:MAG: peptidoglycan synthetase [Bacteroidetes bacterium]|nr:peptidoglycan synthetase [Bacteroidota bacterium]
MQRIHFIAIGGAIMHQLALALLREGHQISGSDDAIANPAKSNLAAAGILPQKEGWYPETITSDLDAIVLGMHAREDNPELKAALELGVPVFSFPEYVYKVSENKKRVVVAGSHGKTTITSMIMHVLKACQLDFDYLVGAKVPGFDSSVRLSTAPIIILEGDEYPASALERKPKIFFYHPHISVLSGISWDHINVFPTYENYLSQFETYLNNMQAQAILVYNDEDAEVRKLVAHSGRQLVQLPYVTPPFHYEEGVAVLESSEGNHPVSVFGRHNLLNLEAARKVCLELGVSDAQFYRAIADFTGAARRLERLFSQGGVLAFRDFAHAPSKLKATLDAVREALPQRYLIAVFELHTFSSLNDAFMEEYAGAMAQADAAIVFYSEHALQLKGLPPLDPAQVKAHFHRDDLTVVHSKASLEQLVTEQIARAGKEVCLLLMSSGTFDGLDWKVWMK